MHVLAAGEGGGCNDRSRVGTVLSVFVRDAELVWLLREKKKLLGNGGD